MKCVANQEPVKKWLTIVWDYVSLEVHQFDTLTEATDFALEYDTRETTRKVIVASTQAWKNYEQLS
jgi:hypothetical protein